MQRFTQLLVIGLALCLGRGAWGALPTTNLTFHTDTSAATHLYKTQGGGSLAGSSGTPADGDAVEAAICESDCSRSTSGLTWFSSNTQAPLFRSGGSALMANSCLDFDGTNDAFAMLQNGYTAETLSTIASTSAFTIYIAFYPESITATSSSPELNQSLFGDGANQYFNIMLKNNSGTKQIYAMDYDGGASYLVAGPITITENASHVVRVRLNSGTLYISLDGGAESSVASGAVASAGMLGLSLTSPFYNGRVGEIAIYSDGTAGGNQAAADSYFAAKWLGGGAPPANATNFFFSQHTPAQRWKLTNVYAIAE